MDFISNQEPQIQEMLKVLGISDIDALFADIPAQIKLDRPTVDDGLSEYEGSRLMESLAAKNTFRSFENYLGAGAYEHYIPALTAAICSKSEFLTSYTPYQPEASQGMLQIIFEFQSAICALTGMDVANASVYDGASACAEAALIALRCHPERKKILIAASVHPNYQAVVAQYLAGHGIEVIKVPFQESGELDTAVLKSQLNAETAAVLIQSPNFLGNIENMKEVVALAKPFETLVIQCANPLAYGVFASAGELGVDIAVGDCQPFGLALNYGGPYAGYIACKQALLRQLPGRIVGETVDTQGRRGFVLTLQAREQHIRREKATSNICTNQALAALASLIAILWYGKEGVPKLALTNFQRAAYLKQQLEAIPGVKTTSGAIFNEFLVKFPHPAAQVQRHFRTHQIELGFAVEALYPSLPDWILVAVTETKSKMQLDRYISIAKELRL
ncbi:MAG: aminomethyl-transferring glycine dehydrogenase [Parachlamydia sp.]|nr:MAG: aminomethyl-transferring glycine dehydrogenase [Parachlamydia sp.]